MSASLLSIGASGARAARAALEASAHNIANANTEGYVRRTAQLSELVAAGAGLGDRGLLAGVRVTGTVRHADAFRQAEARRTQADASRATNEIQGLTDIEAALESSGLYEAMSGFEAALGKLSAAPTDPAMRTAAMAAAGAVAGGYNLADRSLVAAGEGMTAGAAGGVEAINTAARQLADLNLKIARSQSDSNGAAALFDQRDQLLASLSDRIDIASSFASNGTVQVRLGGANGPPLVAGVTAGSLAMTRAADGTLSFAVDGAAIRPAGGSLAGQANALRSLADTRAALDASADRFADFANGGQGNGAALDGSAGQPLFRGAGAGGITLAFTDGAGLATAPAGSPAGSRDPGNLAALRSALDEGAVAGGISAIMLGVSTLVASGEVTGATLGAIADTARAAVQSQSGVDLDEEAANLVRFQQVFEASGRAMQVASDLFDTLLGIR